MSPPPFEMILPEVESRSRRHYSHLPPDAREEAIAESVAHAYAMHRSAVARGNWRFTPCTLAWYANRAVDEGRRFAGTSSTDALDRAVSLDSLDADGHERIAEALVERRTPVFDEARIRVDWPEFLKRDLPERERDLVTRLAEGWRKSEVAAHLGVARSRVSQLLGEVGEAYVETFGTPGFEQRARRRRRRGSREAARKSRKLDARAQAPTA